METERWLWLAAALAAAVLFVLHRRRIAGVDPEENEAIRDYLESGLFDHVKGVELGQSGDHRGAEEYFRREVERYRQDRPPNDPDLRRARANLVVCLTRQYRFADAEAVHREELAELESAFGRANPAAGEIRLELIRLLRHQDKLDEAETLLREQEELAGRLFGGRDETDLDLLFELGAIQSQRGDHEAAEATLAAIIAEKERTLGPVHPETLRHRRTLAGELRFQGRDDEAGAMLQTILREQRQAGADEDAAHTSEQLADLYLETDRAPEAAAILDELYDALRRTLPPDHPAILAMASRRAAAMEATGDLVRAESVLQGALDGYEAAFGPDHPDALASREMLARFLERRNRDREAGEHFRQLGYHMGQLHGQDAAQTLRARFFYGCSLLYQDNIAEAEHELRLVHDALTRDPGPEAVETLCCAERLAWTLLTAGRHREARDLLEPRLDAAEAVLTPRDVWAYHSALANALAGEGEFAASEPHWRRALELMEVGLGPEAPWVLLALDGLGNALLQQEKLEEAEDVIQEVCARTEESLGEEAPALLPRTRALAEIRHRRGRYAEAKESWDDVIEACKRDKLKGTIYYAECLQGLAGTLTALGLPKDALPLERESEAILARYQKPSPSPLDPPPPEPTTLGIVWNMRVWFLILLFFIGFRTIRSCIAHPRPSNVPQIRNNPTQPTSPAVPDVPAYEAARSADDI